MSEPKLTEALAEALREADEYGYGLRDRDLPRQLGFVIAPIIATAEKAARAAAWDEGWKAGQGSGFRFTPPNPYRSTP